MNESLPWKTCFWGVVLPLALALYGVWCCVAQKGMMLSKYHGVRMVTGPAAVGMGIFWIGVALLLHFNNVSWNPSPRFAYFEQVGKLVACLLIGAGFVLMVFGVFYR